MELKDPDAVEETNEVGTESGTVKVETVVGTGTDGIGTKTGKVWTSTGTLTEAGKGKETTSDESEGKGVVMVGGADGNITLLAL